MVLNFPKSSERRESKNTSQNEMIFFSKLFLLKTNTFLLTFLGNFNRLNKVLSFSNLLEAERLPSLLRNFMQIRYISVLVPGCQSVMFMQIFKSELPLKATANVLHSGTKL